MRGEGGQHHAGRADARVWSTMLPDVISLTSERSHSVFSYDALDRLVQQGGDGRTQRYHYDLTGKLTQSEDEGLSPLWHYDASDRITHRTVNGDPAGMAV
ncbi:hypothetical protein BANRA_01055 [Escherichia coli]|nr:hypothetical protein BANRA_01055 [Escherichia coli]